MNRMNPLNYRITEGLSKSITLSVSIPIDQRIPSWNLFVLHFWAKRPGIQNKVLFSNQSSRIIWVPGCYFGMCWNRLLRPRNAQRTKASLFTRAPSLGSQPLSVFRAFFGWGSPSVLLRNSGINIWKFTVCSSCYGFYSWCLFILFSGSSHDGAEHFWKLEKNSHCCDFWHEEIHLTPSNSWGQGTSKEYSTYSSYPGNPQP